MDLTPVVLGIIALLFFCFLFDVAIRWRTRRHRGDGGAQAAGVEMQTLPPLPKENSREDALLVNNMSYLKEAIDLNCSICLSILIEPVTGPCGHNWCRACIGKWQRTTPGSGNCPVCRARLPPTLRVNVLLHQLVVQQQKQLEASNPAAAAADDDTRAAPSDEAAAGQAAEEEEGGGGGGGEQPQSALAQI